MGAVAGGGAAAGTGATAGGGGSSGSAGAPMVEEPDLVTSAQGAFWQEGTFTEVASGNADITVNDQTIYQTWDGFGGTFNEVGWDVLSLLGQADRDRAIELLFGINGARFAFGRVPIGASDYAVTRYTLAETPNDYSMDQFSIAHDQQYLIPYIQAALAVKSDIRLWASPWSPPPWMKDNNAIDGGNMRDDAMILSAHALNLAKFDEEYAKNGNTNEANHPQN
jgi:glucosylceramidase